MLRGCTSGQGTPGDQNDAARWTDGDERCGWCPPRRGNGWGAGDRLLDVSDVEGHRLQQFDTDVGVVGFVECNEPWWQGRRDKGRWGGRGNQAAEGTRMVGMVLGVL